MLTVEDGTSLADANSLISVEDARSYATLRGVALPEDDSELEVLIIKANDYLIALEPQLQGWRTSSTQGMPFPRVNVRLYGRILVHNQLPSTLISGLCQLVCELVSGEIMPVSDGRVILVETVGPISTEYQPSGISGFIPRFPVVDAFLLPLTVNGGSLLTTRA